MCAYSCARLQKKELVQLQLHLQLVLVHRLLVLLLMQAYCQNALWAAGQCQPWEYEELLEQPCLLPHLRQLASVLVFKAVVAAAPLVAAAAAAL